jgi:hypothetical protein
LVPDWRVHRLYSVHSAGSGTEVQRCTRGHYSYRLPSLPFGLYMQQSEFDTTCAVAVARAVQNLLKYLNWKQRGPTLQVCNTGNKKKRAGKMRRTKRDCGGMPCAATCPYHVPPRPLPVSKSPHFPVERPQPRGTPGRATRRDALGGTSNQWFAMALPPSDHQPQEVTQFYP